MSRPLEVDLDARSTSRLRATLDPIVYDDAATKQYCDNYKHNVIYDHFFGGVLDSGWTAQVDGLLLTTSSVTPQALAISGAAGVLQLASSASGAFSAIHAGQNFTMLGNNYVHSFGGRFRLPLLSSTADAFTIRVGLSGTVSAAADPSDGVYLRYSHSYNGGAFQLVCRRNGSESVANTSILAVAGQWVNFRIQVNEAADTAMLFLGVDNVRGVLAATLTTSIPLTTTTLGFFCRLVKSAGTSARALHLDLLHYDLRTMIVPA